MKHLHKRFCAETILKKYSRTFGKIIWTLEKIGKNILL